MPPGVGAYSGLFELAAYMNHTRLTTSYKFQGFFRLLTFALIMGLGRAQTVDTTRTLIEDGYIEKMTDNIGLDISMNNAFSIFEVVTASNTILLYPNTPNNLRLNINYDFISLGFETAPDFLPGNDDELERGNTKSFKLGSAFIFKHWFVDASYSRLKGFYLRNTEDFIPWNKGDPYTQFPDLLYKGFSLSSGYIDNSRFSFRSLTSQTERQLKSAGSFVPDINFEYYIIDDRSADINTQTSKNFEVGIGPGYVHTFVIKEKFYGSLGAYSSLGYLNTRLTTRTPQGEVVTHQDNFMFRWDGQVGLGYNGGTFYTGLYANVSGSRYRQENTTAINHETRIIYHLFLGIRLRAPDYLRRMTTKIKKTLN